MKKKIVLIMLFVLMISSASFANPSDWAENDINSIKANGRLEDRAFGDFQDKITRKDFAYLGVKMYEIITGESTSVGTASFTDSSDEFVLKAKNAGFIDGVGNGLFEPDREITRDEIAALFVKLYNVTGVSYIPGVAAQDFADKDEIASWAQDYVKIARANEIVNGVGENKFSPKEKATREVALIMYKRTLDKFEGSLVVQIKDNIVVETVSDADAYYDMYRDGYEQGLVNKELNFYKDTFPEWAVTSYVAQPLYEFDKPGKSLFTEFLLFNPDYEGYITEADFPIMVEGVVASMPTIETIQDVMANSMVSKTMPVTTQQDWDRVYQVFTQEYAYPELSRSPLEKFLKFSIFQF